MLGPFHVASRNIHHLNIAPPNELADREIASVLTGKILKRNCKPVEEATVEVWYAGLTGKNYTFPPGKLWYRGNQTIEEDGSYKFLATFPIIYTERPILHYHFKVITPGVRGKEFITQAYFEDKIPPAFLEYVEGRKNQFAEIRFVKKNKDLVNGGRVILFDIVLDVL